MKRFLVTQSPKPQFRAAYNVSAVLVEAENSKQAIEKSGLVESNEFKKIRADLAAFNVVFYL